MNSLPAHSTFFLKAFRKKKYINCFLCALIFLNLNYLVPQGNCTLTLPATSYRRGDEGGTGYRKAEGTISGLFPGVAVGWNGFFFFFFCWFHLHSWCIYCPQLTIPRSMSHSVTLVGTCHLSWRWRSPTAVEECKPHLYSSSLFLMCLKKKSRVNPTANPAEAEDWAKWHL